MSIHWHVKADDCPHSNEHVCPTCDFDRYYAKTYPECPWRSEDVFMVTGSREWSDWESITVELVKLEKEGFIRLLVGDATGADYIASQVWLMLGGQVQTFVADWSKYGKSAGLRRNQEMVDAKPKLCLAFPRRNSRGTFDAITRARKAGIEVRVVRAPDEQWPDQPAQEVQ